LAERRNFPKLADYIQWLREQGEWKKAEEMEKAQAAWKEKKK
jgi:hypothetical protein